MTTALEWMLQGKLFNAFFQPFIDIGVPVALVYVILYFFGVTALYIRTRSLESVGVLSMLFAPVILQSAFGVIPYIGEYLAAFVVIGFAFVFYKLLKETH